MKNLNNNKFIPYVLLFILALAQTYFLVIKAPVLHIVVYMLSSFFLFVLLGSINRRLLNFFIILFLIIITVVYPTHAKYGKIDIVTITSLYYSNTAEISSYMKSISSAIYIKLALLYLYSFFLVFKKNMKLKLPSKAKIALLIFVLFPTIRQLKSSIEGRTKQDRTSLKAGNLGN